MRSVIVVIVISILVFSYLSHQLPIGRTEGYDPARPKDKQIYEMIENKIEEESQQVNNLLVSPTRRWRDVGESETETALDSRE